MHKHFLGELIADAMRKPGGGPAPATSARTGALAPLAVRVPSAAASNATTAPPTTA
jgi:hypothetical protein